MNRFLLVVVFLTLFFTGIAAAADRVEPPKACQSCGMDRVAFAYSRMVIDYADGTSDGVCSLNCAVEQMKKYRTRQVRSLKVADYATRELVDVRTATWVIGGNKPGVMTAVPKWAFARKENAEKFVKENGGRLSTFDEALELALKENE
jgi:nitrous oxide reductase accessory protein NosL